MGIIVVTLSLFAAPAFAACEISGVSGMSDSVKAELKADCLKRLGDAALTNASPVPGVDMTDPEALSQWGQVAQEWAKAMGLAAQELGIAANEFLGTGAGKLTAALIIWHVVGDALLGFVLGIPLLITIITVGLRLAKSLRIEDIKYGEGRTWFGRKKVESIRYKDADDVVMVWITYIATIVLSAVVIAAVIIQ